MVLEPQTMLPNGALQLYAAAAAAQFGGPRSRVPPWAPFLQFGMPGMSMFGNSFLTRPRFGPSGGAAVGSPVGGGSGVNGAPGGQHPGHPLGAGGIAQHMSRNTNTNSSGNSNLGGQSDDDEDDKGEWCVGDFIYNYCRRQRDQESSMTKTERRTTKEKILFRLKFTSKVQP